MISFLVLFAVASSSLSCGRAQKLEEACLMISYVPTISFEITSSAPMPANVAFGLSSDPNKIEIGECAGNQWSPTSSLTVDPDRKGAKARFDTYDLNGAEPANVDLHLFSAPNCGDPYTAVSVAQAVKITWTPIYQCDGSRVASGAGDASF